MLMFERHDTARPSCMRFRNLLENVSKSISTDEMHPAELLLHTAVVSLALLFFAWKGYQFSWKFELGQEWDGYAPGLQPGMLGRRVDMSDIQWRDFRAGLPAMAAFFVGAAGAARWLQHTGGRPVSRASCHLLFSLAFLCHLHGACTAFVLIMGMTSFCLAQAAAGRRHGTAAIWLGNVLLLLSARIGEGFRFAAINDALAHLDMHRGVMRWDICFNMCILRMLSYGLDLHRHRQSADTHKRQNPEPCMGTSHPRPVPEASPTRQHAAVFQEGDYSLLMYMAYVFYAPLYLAGPIITYQDFSWQLKRGSLPFGTTVAQCGVRLAADWACLELLTHCLYFNSIAKHRVGLLYRKHGLAYGPIEVALTAFWVLCFMWLKFGTIWRFFRLAALLGGVDPPENMRRCFANNYDLEGFWRGWHTSFNQWLVRYMYVPLGGRQRRVLAIWPIFFFVALWHDLEWRLLSWAWLVCLAFLPEMAAKRLVGSRRLDAWRGTAVFRHVCAAAAAINISVLMSANLAGFVVGLDGLQGLLSEMLASPRFVATTFITFWSAANLQLWLREKKGSLCFRDGMCRQKWQQARRDM